MKGTSGPATNEPQLHDEIDAGESVRAQNDRGKWALALVVGPRF